MQATHLYALRQRPLFGYWSISARRATWSGRPSRWASRPCRPLRTAIQRVWA